MRKIFIKLVYMDCIVIKIQDLVVRKTLDFTSLADKIVTVDIPNIIMSLFNFARKNPDGSRAGLILDRTQRLISHLNGLLRGL